DGATSRKELQAVSDEASQARKDVHAARMKSGHRIPELFTHAAIAAKFAVPHRIDGVHAATGIAAACSLIGRYEQSGLGGHAEIEASLCAILRELFGPVPFRSAS